jgi:sodium ion-translocating decarboxylase beta subunit
MNVTKQSFVFLLVFFQLALSAWGQQSPEPQIEIPSPPPELQKTESPAHPEPAKTSIRESFAKLWRSTGIYGFIHGVESTKAKPEEKKSEYRKDDMPKKTAGWRMLIMVSIGILLIYLGISKGFEPLLLIPIGFGGILANIPFSGVVIPGEGFLALIFSVGIESGIFPLLIFLGVGAMTDFGPLIANPKTALLGAAAQFGIFATVIGAIWLSQNVESIHYSIKDAGAIGIIGGADGPTAIFLATNLAPDLLGAIAVAAYSYMALVPIIQPPIMKLLTTEEERKIEMKQLRHVSKAEKIVFPLMVLLICGMLLPSAIPLVGMLMLGNLFKECGVVERLSKTAANELINIVTILLGLGVGSKLAADKFLQTETLGILALGLVAFAIGTASGLLLARLMNMFSKDKINPLIGSAGVSAVPMAARVSNKMGMEANPQNFLLMHAMGPNVAGVLGSAVAAGVLLSLLG